MKLAYLLFGILIVLFLTEVFTLIKIKRSNRVEKELSKIKNSKILKDYEINNRKADYLIICDKGIIVVNILDVKGDVFGSNHDKYYEISYHDKVVAIPSPTIQTREYVKDLYKVVKRMNYFHLQIYQATVFNKANSKNVKCNIVYNSVKDVVNSLKALPNNLNKQDMYDLAIRLDDQRLENLVVNTQDNDVVYTEMSTEKIYK